MPTSSQAVSGSNLLPLYRFALIPHFDDRLADLAALAERDEWAYRTTPAKRSHPVLFNYLHYTFSRVEEQGRIAISSDGNHACWNSGLVTEHQEAVYLLFDRNLFSGDARKWHFRKFCRRGERELNLFAQLPDMATYFDDPSCLVFDCKLEFRPNIEHIIEENKSRFPTPYNVEDDYALQLRLRGAIDNARERVRRNYKTAIPQFYQGRVQLLLPLCLSKAAVADLALVVERFDGFYRAATCLTLDMAYNNARQLARPDRDWLQP